MTITADEQTEIDHANASASTPIVFVHGLWLLPSSWRGWRDAAESQGFVTLAPGWPGDPETVAGRGVSSDSRLDVEAALGRIPEAQRQVIELHWFAGLPFQDIAEAVGASVGAVKVRAHRGYEAMRALLLGGGDDR